MTSPVDRRISFFGSQDPHGETRVSSLDQTGSESLWSHLQEDKIWQTVLEYYYSLCNVSSDQRSQALNVYIKKRIKQKSERRGSKKSLSYTEIAHKLGILSVNTTHAEVSKQESQNTEENRTASEGMSCTTTAASTSGCSVIQDNGSTEHYCADRCSTNSTLVNDSIKGSQSDSCQTSSCDTMKLPSISSNCQPAGKSSCKSSSEKDSTSQQILSNECRTSCTSSGTKSPRYTNVLINLEKVHMDRISSPPSSSWNINNDLVLVHFLCDIHEKLNQGKCKVSINFH